MQNTATVNEMIGTGKYDEKKLAKFWNKQYTINGNDAVLADMMVRIYKHNFEIRVAKQISK